MPGCGVGTKTMFVGIEALSYFVYSGNNSVMPKIYEYKGFHFSFYSNDHAPEHVHVRKSDREIKIEFHNISGAISFKWILITTTRRFNTSELKEIDKFTRAYYHRIIKKWNIFYSGKTPKCEQINKIRKENKPKKGS